MLQSYAEVKVVQVPLDETHQKIMGNSPDQKIVENSLQPIGVIITGNLFIKAAIGQCG